MGEVTGISRRLQQGLSLGYGYTAIIVAWMAQLNPLAIPFVAVLDGRPPRRRRPGADDDGPARRRWDSLMQGMILFPMLAGSLFTEYRIKRMTGTQAPRSRAGGGGVMDLITSILAITLRAGTSLVYATIGETYTERAGILNLGLEGIMLMGAVSSFATAYYSGNLVARPPRRPRRRRAHGADTRLPAP
ncbi:MAG: hypothetical protein MZV70_68040 [Desulfobacterales bacterium]|nr:hypothetical protein [Desulfobacterales bacterium]